MNQSALEGVERGARPGGHADLGIEALDVVVDGLESDVELARSTFCRVPGSDQPQHLDFAWRQPRETLGDDAAGRLPRHGEDRLDRLGTELAVPDGRAQFC